MKQIALTVIAGFVLSWAPFASASVMQHQEQLAQSYVPTYVSALGPNESVSYTLASADNGGQSAAAEAPVGYTPSIATQQAVAALENSFAGSDSNYNFVSATIGVAPKASPDPRPDPPAAIPATLAATPEPASVSFVLMTLLLGGLCVVRRRQSKSNSTAV